MRHDGPVLGEPVLDGPVLDGPVLDEQHFERQHFERQTMNGTTLDAPADIWVRTDLQRALRAELWPLQTFLL